jgi:hypothetical protein
MALSIKTFSLYSYIQYVSFYVNVYCDCLHLSTLMSEIYFRLTTSFFRVHVSV